MKQANIVSTSIPPPHGCPLSARGAIGKCRKKQFATDFSLLSFFFLFFSFHFAFFFFPFVRRSTISFSFFFSFLSQRLGKETWDFLRKAGEALQIT